MRGTGAGEPTVRVALALLQSILRLAVTEERIATNPVGLIEKPSSLPDGGLDPIAPAIVEAMRRAAIARRGPLGGVDAFIVGVLCRRTGRPWRRRVRAVYARIFEGYDPARRTSAEQAIRAARQLEGRAKDAIRGETPSGATR